MSEEISKNTKGTIRDLELTLAEMFGRDGDGGRFKQLEDKVEKHDAVLDSFKTFKIQVMTVVVIAGSIVGVLVTLISKWL